MILPSLREASTDKRLKGAPIRVLVYLHGRLELGEYTVVKTWVVARDIGMDRSRVGRAIRTLIRCGYIREGHALEHNIRRFMLLANPQQEAV